MLLSSGNLSSIAELIYDRGELFIKLINDRCILYNMRVGSLTDVQEQAGGVFALKFFCDHSQYLAGTDHLDTLRDMTNG